MGSIQIKRVLNMKDTGRMINNMVKELKLGMKDHATRACMLMVKKKAWVDINGLMDQFMKVNG
jgi:hypothetical protein